MKVLLILAGITIGLVTGDNGILSQATRAQEKTTQAQEEENIKLTVMASSIEDNGYAEILDEESFKKELKNVFGNQELNVTSNGDGSFLITIDDRKYYVNDDKTVISNDNIIDIGTAEELKAFRDDVNSGNTYEGKVVLLTNDIDLGGEEWEPIGYYDEETEQTHDFESEVNKSFKGIFDGENNEIEGITISSEKIANGFFGLVIEGTIRNVVISKNSNVSGNARTAGIIGYLYGINGNISNCKNYATVVGGDTTAGRVGSIIGQHIIFNCANYGEITGMGGIVGASNGYGGWVSPFEEYSHKIVNCTNYGNIIRCNGGNKNYCGGIVGYFNGNILNCCNKAKIIGNQLSTGGIAGGIDGRVENCYNTNNIEGNRSVGGICNASSTFGANVINCYSIGTITGTASIGDIIGGGSNDESNKIINCYTKNDTFTAEDLGDAFVDDTENVNGGYPLLYWE